MLLVNLFQSSFRRVRGLHNRRIWRNLYSKIALFLVALLLSQALATLSVPTLATTTTGSQPQQITQQPSDTGQDSNNTSAERIYQEGVKLFKEGTAESLRQAIEKFKQAQQLYHAAGNRKDEATALGYIGFIYDALGEKQKALEYFNQSLPLRRQVGDKSGEATTLSNIGAVYSALGEKQKALEYFNQSLPLRRQVGDKSGEATTLTNIGLVYSDLGEKQKALEYYNQSLPLFRQVGDKSGEATTLSNIGAVYDNLGEKQKALEYFNQSLPLSRQVGDKSGEATTLTNIGLVYSDLGEKQKALEYYNQSLPLRRQVGDKSGEATTLNNIGAVYDNLGEKQKALEYFNQSLPLSRQVGDKSGEATTLTNIGLVYSDLGEKQKALEYYNQSLPLRRQVGDKSGEATTLNNIGAVYDNLGEKQKALEYFNQSLPLSRQVGDKSGEATTLTNIGLVYSDLGEKQKALEYYNQSLPLRRQVGDKSGEATTLNNIGAVYDNLGEKQKALEYFNQSLPLSRQVGDKSGEESTLYNIAYLERDGGNLKQALTQIEASIKLIEFLRTKVTNQQLRTSYFATVQDRYKFYIDLLMRLHKNNPSSGYDGKALYASESARARSLLEILNEAGTDIRAGVDSKLLQSERIAKQRLSKIEQLRVQILSRPHKPEEAAAIQQELEKLLTQYEDVEAQIRVKSPRYAALTQPTPLTLQEIQSKVLSDDSLLLEYFLGDSRSYLWAVTKTGINSYELPKNADIETAAKAFRQNVIRVGASSNSQKQTTATLSDMLLKPVASQLGKKRLLIVGDGTLQYIPFAALTVPGKGKQTEFLNVRHEIINLPLASTLGIIRNQTRNRKPAPKTITILADAVFTIDDERVKIPAPTVATTQLNIPSELKRAADDSGISFQRLPGTRREANRILALVSPKLSQSRFGFEANLTAATNPKLSQYQIIHFATHGILNSNRPELSGVVLSLIDEKGISQSGFLRLNDIYNLNLPAEIVVLSACQTGLGKKVKGEGLVGLTRGFMYAGAKRVVVSLWSVDDDATAELMARFYTKVLKEKMLPSAALRAAQIEISKIEKWKNPYYWAAFVIQGEF